MISLGKEVRDKLVEARKGFLSVTGKDEGKRLCIFMYRRKWYFVISFFSLGAGPHVQLLRASTKVRGPYLDPINVVQAELLKRLRACDDDCNLNECELEDKDLLRDALIVSINGVAQGMRNSG